MAYLFSSAFLFVLFFNVLQILAADLTCPGPPKTCWCIQAEGSQPQDYWTVGCESKDLPELKPSDPKLTTYTFALYSDQAYALTSKYFEAFSSIKELDLHQNGSNYRPDVLDLEDGTIDTYSGPPVQQKFADDAFANVKIDALLTWHIGSLLPPPTALKALGKNGLQTLSIQSHGPAKLEAKSFVDFATLTSITIQDTEIDSIDQNAFYGINHYLTTLALNDCGLTEFPTAALSYMNQLKSLSLANNRIKSVTPRVFEKFANLTYLQLNGNPLVDSIEKGALDGLPSHIKMVNLANVGFENIPKQMMSTNPKLQIIYLTDNSIGKINTDDLLLSTGLTQLTLDNNPVSQIDNGAFQTTKSLTRVSLQNTSFESFDCSVFSGFDQIRVYLDFCQSLKSLELSSTSSMPRSMTISITNSSLETISEKFEEALDKNSLGSLDISDNTNLQCKTLDWLASYAICGKSVKVENSQCTDVAMSVEDYLTSKLTVPCATTSTMMPPTEATTPTIAPTTTTVDNPATKGASGLVPSMLVMAAALVFAMK